MDNEELKVKCLEITLMLQQCSRESPSADWYDIGHIKAANEIYAYVKKEWLVEKEIQIAKDREELGYDPALLLRFDQDTDSLTPEIHCWYWMPSQIHDIFKRENIIYFGDLIYFGGLFAAGPCTRKIPGIGKVYYQDIKGELRRRKIRLGLSEDQWHHIRSDIDNLRDLHKDKIIRRMDIEYLES